MRVRAVSLTPCILPPIPTFVNQPYQSLRLVLALMEIREVRPEAFGEACIDRARRAGKSVITLRTTSHMTAAQRLYTAAGFEREPQRDLRFEDGLVLMSFRLEL